MFSAINGRVQLDTAISELSIVQSGVEDQIIITRANWLTISVLSSTFNSSSGHFDRL
jgi:hypothetical protein